MVMDIKTIGLHSACLILVMTCKGYFLVTILAKIGIRSEGELDKQLSIRVKGIT